MNTFSEVCVNPIVANGHFWSKILVFRSCHQSHVQTLRLAAPHCRGRAKIQILLLFLHIQVRVVTILLHGITLELTLLGCNCHNAGLAQLWYCLIKMHKYENAGLILTKLRFGLPKIQNAKMQERYRHGRGESWMRSHSFWGQQLQWRPGSYTFLL